MASSFNVSGLHVLVITQGQWGERIADTVSRCCPTAWVVERWKAPPALPLIIDEPADFLPVTLPKTDLLLAVGETPALAQLIPELAQKTGARSVIAPIDRSDSLPDGLAAQLRGWLADLGVTVAFPKPFCSLTESTYNLPPRVVAYADPMIGEFARYFGRPRLRILVDADKHINQVEVERDSACGCARFVAQGLINVSVEQAEHEAGMLHHHYPCLASMTQDADYHDTLMHVSGHILRAAVKDQVSAELEPIPYMRPNS